MVIDSRLTPLVEHFSSFGVEQIEGSCMTYHWSYEALLGPLKFNDSRSSSGPAVESGVAVNVDLIIEERTYAVAYTSLSRITEIHNPIEPSQYPSLKSRGINNALNNRQGKYLYLNHERKPVVGAYQYIPVANMGLLIEREQSILFKEARRRLIKILIIGFSMSGFAFLALKQLKERHLKQSL